MANYNDPVLQKLLQKRAAMNPYGGVRSVAPEIEKYMGEQEKRRLQLNQVGLEGKMNTAKIGNMAFERGIMEKNMGLQQGYIDLAGKEFGLAEKGFGIRSQLAALANEEAAWRHSMVKKNINQQKNELNLQTLLGLGTAGYAAYEGNRRATEVREATKKQKEWWENNIVGPGLLSGGVK